MTTILVLGATGFLGRRIVELAAHQAEVVAVVRPGGRDRAPAGAAVRELDPGDGEAGARLFRAVAPTSVIDAAWSGVTAGTRNDSTVQHDNVERVRQLAGVAGSVAAWVGLGSQAEYGPVEGRVSETAPLRPMSAYGDAKLAVHRALEHELAPRGGRVCWLRVFSGYGPGQPAGWLVPDAVRALLAGRPVLASDGRQRRDYVHADDVARAAVLAATIPGASGAFNVGSGAAVSIRTLLELLHTLTGNRGELRFGARARRPGEAEVIEADIRRAAAVLRWQPRVPLRDGLAQVVAAASGA